MTLFGLLSLIVVVFFVFPALAVIFAGLIAWVELNPEAFRLWVEFMLHITLGLVGLFGLVGLLSWWSATKADRRANREAVAEIQEWLNSIGWVMGQHSDRDNGDGTTGN